MTWGLRDRGKKTEEEKTMLEKKAKALHSKHPASSLAECRRFVTAFGSTQGGKHLRAYLEWKEAHGLFSNDATAATTAAEEEEDYDDDDDAADWDRAIRKAHAFHHSKDGHTSASFAEDEALEQRSENAVPAENEGAKVKYHPSLQPNPLPQIALAPLVEKQPMVDAQNHRILYVLPARMDVREVSAELYTTAFALYLHRKLSKTRQLSDDDDDDSKAAPAAARLRPRRRITVCLDVRPAPGWPNPPVAHWIAPIRRCVGRLHRLFPDTLERCLVFPVPRWAVRVHRRLVAPVLDRGVRDAVALIAGDEGAGRHAPVPSLRPHLTEDQAAHLERLRRRAFGGRRDPASTA